MTTTSYQLADFRTGWGGHVSETRTAGRLYVLPYQDSSGGGGVSYSAAWIGWITGSEASMIFSSNFGNGSDKGDMIFVSVDGSPLATPASSTSALSGGGRQFELFTGLSDTEHFVIVTASGGYGDTVYQTYGVDSLFITGATPSLRLPSGFTHAGAQSGGKCITSCPMTPAGNGFEDICLDAGTTYGNFMNGFAFRATFTGKLLITSSAKHVCVSIDDGLPVVYDNTRNSPFIQIDVVAGVHDVAVWNDSPGPNSLFAGGFFSGALIPPPHYARSLLGTMSLGTGTGSHDGQGGVFSGEVSTCLAAPRLGRIGASFGVDGQTLAEIVDRFLATLPYLTITSRDDAALLAGRNDGNAWNSDYETKLAAFIDGCLNKGFGKVIIRGCPPKPSDAADAYALFNAGQQAYVTGLADPRVVYFYDPQEQFCQTGSDNTHWDQTGQAQDAALLLTGYRTLDLATNKPSAIALTGPTSTVLGHGALTYNFAVDFPLWVDTPFALADGDHDGTITPASLSVAAGSRAGSFSLTPTEYASQAIAVSGGSLTSNTVTLVVAQQSYDITMASSGTEGQPIAGTISITGGFPGAHLFTPALVGLSGALEVDESVVGQVIVPGGVDQHRDFVFIPDAGGTGTLDFENDAGMAVPAAHPLTIAAAGPITGTIATPDARTFRLDPARTRPTGCAEAHDPNDIVDYKILWSPFLVVGEEISTVHSYVSKGDDLGFSIGASDRRLGIDAPNGATGYWLLCTSEQTKAGPIPSNTTVEVTTQITTNGTPPRQIERTTYHRIAQC